MMSTGDCPIAGLPHHGGLKHESTYDPHDLHHPGYHRDTLQSARAGWVGHVCLADNWLNIRWRS